MTPTVAATYLAALLALYPHGLYRQRILAARESISQRLSDAENTLGVPVPVLLAVAWNESHLGFAPGSGGCWGAPINAAHRLTAGTSVHAARVLARGRTYCRGSWRGAIGFFRSGVCSGGVHADYVARVSTLAHRLTTATNTPLPAGL